MAIIEKGLREGTDQYTAGAVTQLPELPPRILGEEILYQQGGFKRVRRYLAGYHPHLGALHFGWAGLETIQETDVISPIRLINVTGSGEAT